MPTNSSKNYTDAKGRTRWTRNDEVAFVIKQLGEYLIIGGYPEAHAKRYAQLAHTISRWPELIDQMASTNRLEELPGVGGTITVYVQEIIDTGTTHKFDDDQYGSPPPRSVLELTTIERLGAKMAKRLYQDLGIDSLQQLCVALKQGRLDGFKGLGPKMKQAISEKCQR